MPLDRGIIDQQLQALGESPRWWEQREFANLPAVLHADERILAVSRGKVARLRALRRKWLVVVTDRRLVCMRNAGRASWRQLQVSADQITRVVLRIGPFHGRVVVVARDRSYRLLVSRADGYKVSSALSTLSAPAQETHSVLRPTIIARRVIDHVLALPAAAFSPDAPVRPQPASSEILDLNERLQSLQDEVEELRRQIEFLEQLLQQQQQIGARADRLPRS